MAPEYGATCGCPIDEQTMEVVELTNRSEAQCAIIKTMPSIKVFGMIMTRYVLYGCDQY